METLEKLSWKLGREMAGGGWVAVSSKKKSTNSKSR